MVAPRNDESVQKQRIQVERGLVLIRYDRAVDERNPPVVKAVLEGDDARMVKLVLSPDAREAYLSHPGTAFAAVVEATAVIVIEVSPSVRGGSMAASVKVERLEGGDAARPVGVAQLARTSNKHISFGELNLMCHVARRGDLRGKQSEWIGGPRAPSQIEGIAIEWANAPPDVRLRYQVRVGGLRPTNSRMVEAPNFIGTRGRALPIIGVKIELDGPAADQISLEGEALFLGSSVVQRQGRQLVFSGPTVTEPLIGFRLGLTPRGWDADPTPRSEPVAIAAAAPQRRVKVFRAKKD
jgi:hypothetical protein